MLSMLASALFALTRHRWGLRHYWARDGQSICPQEVEGALLEHPSVDSAEVIGIHDPVDGEDVRACITLKNGAERPTSQELIRFARARIGYQAPERS